MSRWGKAAHLPRANHDHPTTRPPDHPYSFPRRPPPPSPSPHPRYGRGDHRAARVHGRVPHGTKHQTRRGTDQHAPSTNRHHRLEIHRLHCPNSSINHSSSSELAPPPPSPATRWPPLPRVLGGMLNWTHAQTHARSTLHLQDDRQIKNGIKTREQVAEILGVDP